MVFSEVNPDNYDKLGIVGCGTIHSEALLVWRRGLKLVRLIRYHYESASFRLRKVKLLHVDGLSVSDAQSGRPPHPDESKSPMLGLTI